MEFGGATIAVAVLRRCGKPVTQQFSRQPAGRYIGPKAPKILF